MSLTGSATGTTRADLIRNAKQTAATYFETECVVVELSNEQCEYVDEGHIGIPRETVSTTFAADWKAEVWHKWEQPAYGFPKCVRCKRGKNHSYEENQ